MSGTIARPAAGGPPGESRSDAETAQEGGRKGWLTPVSVAIGACTLLALALRLFLLSRPGYLLGVTEYDDGPYFGSAVSLVHGFLPYRSFLLVQPPGITLLMIPAIDGRAACVPGSVAYCWSTRGTRWRIPRIYAASFLFDTIAETVRDVDTAVVVTVADCTRCSRRRSAIRWHAP